MTAFSERINLHDFRWDNAFDDCEDARDWRDVAWSYQAQPNLAIQALCYAFDDIIEAVQTMIGRTTFAVPEATMIGHTFKHCWEYILDEMPAADVTWQAIAEAWVKNDFEGRIWTIGIIDRMRQILWNEPFDLTWAARPEEKDIPE